MSSLKLEILLTTVCVNVLTVLGGGPHYCSPGYVNPCQNGATCTGINNGYSYTCTCTVGYMGTNCDLVDCTSTVHCGSYGECLPINGGTDKTCTCFYGWTGSTCNEIDICTPYNQADIVFVIDTSLSGGNSTFIKQKEYVKNFMSKYQVGSPNFRYQFSLVTYSLDATIHFYFNSYSNDLALQNAVDQIDFNGGPSFTGHALSKVRQEVFVSAHGARDTTTVERYVILLTDGLSSDPMDVLTESNALKVDGVKIYTIGGGMSIRHDELLEISSYKGHVFPMSTDDSLQNLLKYTMFGCDKCSTYVSDVAVLMDVSTGIEPKDFDTQIQSVVHLLGLSSIGDNATQFSYSTFAHAVNNIYYFNTFSERVDLIADVSKKTRQSHSNVADVASALNDVYVNGFSASRGSRANSRQIVVLITSGHFADIPQVNAEAKRLKDSGKIFVTIGAGLSANQTNLQEISSDPAFSYIIGDDVYIDVDVLDSLETTLMYDFCSHI